MKIISYDSSDKDVKSVRNFFILVSLSLILFFIVIIYGIVGINRAYYNHNFGMRTIVTIIMLVGGTGLALFLIYYMIHIYFEMQIKGIAEKRFKMIMINNKPMPRIRDISWRFDSLNRFYIVFNLHENIFHASFDLVIEQDIVKEFVKIKKSDWTEEKKDFYLTKGRADVVEKDFMILNRLYNDRRNEFNKLITRYKI